MKEIVEKIMNTEKLAAKSIDMAKAKAEDIISKTNKEKEEIVQKAISKANQLALEKKNKTIEEFLSEKEKIVKETKIQIATHREKIEKNIPETAKKVFEEIIRINI
jgi:vacuolar-type H+-ATPase subunit H